MSVLGLQTTSPFSSSFFTNSHPSPRASSLLKMWQNLEGEHLTSNNFVLGQGSDNGDNNSEYSDDFENRERTCSMKSEHEDNSSVVSEQSSDMGENERERVRSIFRGWMKNGDKSDGLAISPVIGSRKIRRLYGRQTLLDLLVKARKERVRELQDLSEKKHVSDFAHRNRIQAFLRGMFLRNKRSTPDKKSCSVAATELGLIRQRSTVSHLREGFLSKSNNAPQNSTNNAESSEPCLAEENNNQTLQTSPESQSEAQEKSSLDEFLLQETEEEKTFFERDEPISEIVEKADEHDNITVIDDWSSEMEDVVNYNRPPEVFREDEPMTLTSGILEISGRDEPVSESVREGSAEDWSLEIEDVNNYNHPPEFFREDESISTTSDVHEMDGTGQWFQETNGGESLEEHEQIQELRDDLLGRDLQEAIDSWLDFPSIEENSSIGGIDTFNFPDDDNVRGMEIRELYSRRRVSSLLGSSFRANLDRILQSRVERQDLASNQSEVDPTVFEQEREEEYGNQFVTDSQPMWDEELQGGNWPNSISISRHLRTDLDVINELRIDMAKLHYRMNHMQSMLEACMDMQIELQRSVRQEVSATLNRSNFSTNASSCNMFRDDSNWDHVRQGICCICRDSKIESLLYRCGHMCTCSRCSAKLVQDTGKCPMCQAPVVEAVPVCLTKQ